jgi:cell division transport system permease protein
MATALFRIFKYGLQNFYRNGWLSTATIAVMFLALSVFLGLMIFGVVTHSALVSIQEKIDISVYFKNDAAEDEILKVKRSLETLGEIKNVEYISRSKALETFTAQHEDEETIAQALRELQENPLSASLNVKANDVKDYGAIAAYLKNDAFSSVIEKVSYAQNQVVIERLSSIITLSNQVGLVLALFLSLVAGLVIFNTIRLAIYSNREEIGIMRFVGASNNFIRGPYLVVGLMYGVLAGLATVVVGFPVVAFASPYIHVLIPTADLKAYYISHLGGLLGYQLLFGVVLGISSSFISIRRYLKA